MAWNTEEDKIDTIFNEKVINKARERMEDATPLFSNNDVKNWASAGSCFTSKICCLVYGADGTGKTGLVYDYLTEEDVKNGWSMWVIDLDGGGMPLKQTYHQNKKDKLVIIDPMVTKEGKDGTVINYKHTFAKIRAIVRYVHDNWKEQKIKAIVFDGLSTALYYAEQQMRLDKNLDADGGVQLRYWLMRNKLFLETIEQVRSLPIARFFIAHENFQMNNASLTTKPSAVVAKTNAMMIQKISCKRIDSALNVVFTATFDKNKYSVAEEGRSIEICKVDKTTKKYEWKAKDVITALEEIQ